MRHYLILICVLTTACTANGQTGSAGLPDLDTFHPSIAASTPGTDLKSLSSPRFTSPNLLRSAPETTGAEPVGQADTSSAKSGKGNHSRLRHALIGMAIGGGAGAGIGAGVWESHGFFGGKGDGAALCGGVGAVGGLIVGVLWPVHHK